MNFWQPISDFDPSYFKKGKTFFVRVEHEGDVIYREAYFNGEYFDEPYYGQEFSERIIGITHFIDPEKIDFKSIVKVEIYDLNQKKK